MIGTSALPLGPQSSFSIPASGASPFASRRGAAGVLLVPAAMAAGAMGLFALWGLAAANHGPTAKPVAYEAAAPAPGPRLRAADNAAGAHAVVQAAQAQAQRLTGVLVGLGAPAASLPPVAPPSTSATPMAALDGVRDAEDQVVRSAASYAQTRGERLRRAFRVAGVDPRRFSGDGTAIMPLSVLELKDARVLAARFDIDPGLARRMQQAARSLVSVQALQAAARTVPLAAPVDDAARSSGFGMRIDPFTGQTAFHPGQDFAGRFGEDIHATAPGIVAYAGPRGGYGNCVEIDHGGGFKTRYGHMERVDVKVGQPVTLGQTIGQMGSTGRSTGVHVHYEVWKDGVLRDPTGYLKAGEDLQIVASAQPAASGPAPQALAAAAAPPASAAKVAGRHHRGWIRFARRGRVSMRFGAA